MRAAALVVAVAALAPACRRAEPLCTGTHFSLPDLSVPQGFDSPFMLLVQPLCDGVEGGTITWRQVEGPPAREVTIEGRGTRLRGRTPTLAEALGGRPQWGLVPLSPRTQGALVFEAAWTPSDGRGPVERHTVRVVAAARSRGLPNIPLGAPAYLGGTGWRLEAQPAGSAAAIVRSMSMTTFDAETSLTPDVPGDYRLVDGAGRALGLRAGRYDATPLDCGRSGCHVEIARAADASPMTTVLARGIVPVASVGEGSPMARFGAGYPQCALACHATGEPGVSDGGFTHVHGELALGSRLEPRAWESVPAPLRRLGGVGCLACHGPGALPEAAGRWAVLRADVCATCHDAPPRYGHVAAWRTSAMARADRDPRAAREPACARCHTTWGFLAAARGADVDRRPPAEVGAVGLTCAACHAVHEPASTGRTPRLLRAAPVPAVLAGAALPPGADRSLVCLGCHAPEPGEGAPSASAAALWAGRGGLDPATGSALEAPAVHGAVAGGCVGCHQSGREGLALERGAGHAFVATRAGCASCHAKGLPEEDLAARARALWEALPPSVRGGGAGAAPLHARAPRLDRGTPLGRAAWNVSLVLEDRAAAAHNAPYARQLLAAAEKALNGRAP